MCKCSSLSRFVVPTSSWWRITKQHKTGIFITFFFSSCALLKEFFLFWFSRQFLRTCVCLCLCVYVCCILKIRTNAWKKKWKKFAHSPGYCRNVSKLLWKEEFALIGSNMIDYMTDRWWWWWYGAYNNNKQNMSFSFFLPLSALNALLFR